MVSGLPPIAATGSYSSHPQFAPQLPSLPSSPSSDTLSTISTAVSPIMDHPSTVSPELSVASILYHLSRSSAVSAKDAAGLLDFAWQARSDDTSTAIGDMSTPADVVTEQEPVKHGRRGKQAASAKEAAPKRSSARVKARQLVLGVATAASQSHGVESIPKTQKLTRKIWQKHEKRAARQTVVWWWNQVGSTRFEIPPPGGIILPRWKDATALDKEDWRFMHGDVLARIKAAEKPCKNKKEKRKERAEGGLINILYKMERLPDPRQMKVGPPPEVSTDATPHNQDGYDEMV